MKILLTFFLVVSLSFAKDPEGKPLKNKNPTFEFASFKFVAPDSHLILRTEVVAFDGTTIIRDDIGGAKVYDSLTFNLGALVGYSGNFESAKKVVMEKKIVTFLRGKPKNNYGYLVINLHELDEGKHHSLLLEIRGKGAVARLESWHENLINQIR